MCTVRIVNFMQGSSQVVDWYANGNATAIFLGKFLVVFSIDPFLCTIFENSRKNVKGEKIKACVRWTRFCKQTNVNTIEPDNRSSSFPMTFLKHCWFSSNYCFAWENPLADIWRFVSFLVSQSYKLSHKRAVLSGNKSTKCLDVVQFIIHQFENQF